MRIFPPGITRGITEELDLERPQTIGPDAALEILRQAVVAVATAFVGIWGMNFEHMPELKWEWGYPASLAVIGFVCSMMYWRFRRSGWL